MHTPDEKVLNFNEWQELEKKLVDNLSEQDKELYRELNRNEVELLTSDNNLIEFYEKWIDYKPLCIFIIRKYYEYLRCDDNKNISKIMELYLKFIILTNYRDFKLENYLENRL